MIDTLGALSVTLTTLDYFAVNTHSLFRMRSYEHGVAICAFGTASAFDQRYSNNLPYSRLALRIRVLPEASAGATLCSCPPCWHRKTNIGIKDSKGSHGSVDFQGVEFNTSQQ
jgi:hypothetical protein